MAQYAFGQELPVVATSAAIGAGPPQDIASAFAPISFLRRPTSALAQTIPRGIASMSNQAVLLSGRQSFMQITLVAGQLVSALTVWSASTAAVTPTNQWFTLYDATTRAQLAITADDTTTAWATNTAKTLTLASSYTAPTTGIYYVGVMVAAATVPTLMGINAGLTAISTQPPILCGNDATNTGLTTPATAPATAAALTPSALPFYALAS